uniref:Fatty acyl-CoA reductase n=1 Tax=Agrotis segetum TaxID=47767 RepID=A0A068FK94_AGRSE|nr:fatty acyl reductase [Agrotis segetum]
MAVEALTDSQLFESKQGGDITFMDMVDEQEPLGESQIQKLFAGSAVLLTGGTGFLGKLVVEKLLRSCPDLKKIFLLARPKKNKDITKRLQEQFDDVLYDRLRKERPDFISKISIVEGDMGQPELGMCAEDRAKIMNEVDVIFHGAATVRFDEPLKTAVEINVRGTREMFKLARGCTKLKAFVHISTAYSNCPQTSIDEKFYDSPLPGEKLIDLVETMDEQTINNITPGLLGNFPNTYAYTKAVAENIVLEYSKGLPVALFRPAIVIGTAKEPVAGWIDNVYGPTGVVVGAAVGLLHVLNCNPKVKADLVPGDMVVSAAIAAAWRTARDYPTTCNHEDAPPADLPPPVYNYVSSEQKPLTWERFMKYNEVYGFQVPTVQAIYYYVFMLTASKPLYAFYCFMMHWIPAYIVDAIAVLIGKKPMLRKTYAKITKFSEVMAYFATREWKFDNSNTQRLFAEMCPADKKMFDFDMSALDWNDYFYSYIRGVRVYLLKDPVNTVPAGLTKHNRLRFLHYTFCTILGLLFLRILWAVFSMIVGF